MNYRISPNKRMQPDAAKLRRWRIESRRVLQYSYFVRSMLYDVQEAFLLHRKCRLEEEYWGRIKLSLLHVWYLHWLSRLRTRQVSGNTALWICWMGGRKTSCRWCGKWRLTSASTCRPPSATAGYAPRVNVRIWPDSAIRIAEIHYRWVIALRWTAVNQTCPQLI